ncbi:hypothetical protein L9F63_017747, partial [Diploptera punctata]
PPQVILHDRLMTDAVLGTAPIKTEHSLENKMDDIKTFSRILILDFRYLIQCILSHETGWLNKCNAIYQFRFRPIHVSLYNTICYVIFRLTNFTSKSTFFDSCK